MSAWLSRVALPWSALKKLRNNSVLRFAPILLLVVPLYASAQGLLIERGVETPFPINFFVLYFACLCFYLSFFIFDLRCPRLIAENPSVYSYVERCLEHDKFCWDYRAYIEAHRDNIVDLLPNDADEEDFDEAAKGFLHASLRIEEADEIKSIWERNNGDRLVARVFSTFFVFAAGGLSATLVFVDAPIRVLDGFNSAACLAIEAGTHRPAFVQQALQFPWACPRSAHLKIDE